MGDRGKKIWDEEWAWGQSGDWADQNESFLLGSNKWWDWLGRARQDHECLEVRFFISPNKVLLYSKNKQKLLWALVGIKEKDSRRENSFRFPQKGKRKNFYEYLQNRDTKKILKSRKLYYKANRRYIVLALK